MARSIKWQGCYDLTATTATLPFTVQRRYASKRCIQQSLELKLLRARTRGDQIRHLGTMAVLGHNVGQGNRFAQIP